VRPPKQNKTFKRFIIMTVAVQTKL